MQGLILSAAGIGIGLVSSIGLTRIMTGMLVGIQPTDPTTHVAVAVLFLAVTAIACWMPARQAGDVDPVVALREE